MANLGEVGEGGCWLLPEGYRQVKNTIFVLSPSSTPITIVTTFRFFFIVCYKLP